MNFKEWFNYWDDSSLCKMAMWDIEKTPVPMDGDDAEYLQQFSLPEWPNALMQRYNQLLDALSNYAVGEDRVKINRGTSKVVRKVVKKLQDLGYDLRNLNPGSGSLVGMKLMDLNNARRIIGRWLANIGYDPKKRMGRPRKDFFQSGPTVEKLIAGLPIWRPNARQRGSRSYPEGDPRNYIQ